MTGSNNGAEIATSMEQASNVGDVRKPYQLIGQVSGKPSTLSDNVRDVNGGFIADDSAKLGRWREHFEQYLNFVTQPTTPLLSSSAEFLPFHTYAGPCDHTRLWLAGKSAASWNCQSPWDDNGV
ncbi:hypothetical protein SprV_0100165700 [Sparganum proliferum]